jgi:predicted RNA polymerase sigma factor
MPARRSPPATSPGSTRPASGPQTLSRDLTDDAEFLATLLRHLIPAEPEVAGLSALIRLHRARQAARFDGDDKII